MKKSHFSDSQIIAILKPAEGGTPVPELCREHGISSATFYKWRAKFGGMDAIADGSPQRAGRRKPPPEEDVCRRTFEGRNRQRGTRKKVVKPSRRREMAQRAVAEDSVSVRLEQIIEWRGAPSCLRSDNGPEYIGHAMTDWAWENGICLNYIQLGNPQQKAYIERFNRTVRYDWLGHYLFESIRYVQEYAIAWMWTYNHERPNMGLGGITPKQKLAMAN